MLTLAALLSITAPTALVAAQGAPEPISAVSYRDVSIGGAFWGPRLAVLRDATLTANRHQCDITGRIANFEKAACKIRGDAKPGEFEGLLFNDSDVYKMMEGWAYILGAEKDTAKKDALDKELDDLIAKVAAAQHPDGYIDTFYTLKVGVEHRHQAEENDHETYCMGHLIEAGVAHYEATGKKNLLNVATKAGDYLVGLYQPDKFTAPSGHEEVELALVKLSRATGDGKYVKLANFIMDQRGKVHRKLDGTTYGPWGDYAQDHKPVAEQMEASGHAVRAGYLYSGMADLARLGRGEYKPALDSLWEDIVQRRGFVTGGIGPSGHNEGFTVPYDIPTASAYQETCASIATKLYGDEKWITLIHDHNDMGQPPHSLKAGQVLRIPPRIPSDSPDARLTFLRRLVEAYTPDRHPGQRNEPLLRGHRVNTLESSSAEVTFADTSRLQLGEQTAHRLDQGALRSDRREIVDGAERFHERTPQSASTQEEIVGAFARLLHVDMRIGPVRRQRIGLRHHRVLRRRAVPRRVPAPVQGGHGCVSRGVARGSVQRVRSADGGEGGARVIGVAA